MLSNKKPLKGSKKLINAWAFYDWANSVYSLVITTAIFPLYYAALFAENNQIFFSEQNSNILILITKKSSCNVDAISGIE